MKASTAFDILYGDHVQNDNTIVCNRCGYTLYGDDPQIHVTCINCLKQFENGVILRDGVVSLEAAVELEIDFASATPVTTDSHPDGYTCDHTGEVVSL